MKKKFFAFFSISYTYSRLQSLISFKTKTKKGERANVLHQIDTNTMKHGFYEFDGLKFHRRLTTRERQKENKKHTQTHKKKIKQTMKTHESK